MPTGSGDGHEGRDPLVDLLVEVRKVDHHDVFPHIGGSTWSALRAATVPSGAATDPTTDPAADPVAGA